MYSIDIKSRNQLRHVKTNKSQQLHVTFPIFSQRFTGQGLQLVGSHSWWFAAGNFRSQGLRCPVTFILLWDVTAWWTAVPGENGKTIGISTGKGGRNVEEMWKNHEKPLRIRWEMEDFWLENKLNTPWTWDVSKFEAQHIASCVIFDHCRGPGPEHDGTPQPLFHVGSYLGAYLIVLDARPLY